MQTRIAIVTILTACGLAALSSHANAASSSTKPDAVCHDPVLTHQEQDLCIDQIASAQTITERKAVQEKFRKRVTERKKPK